MIVDHRMPQMNGVEMLQEAIKLYPNAKRTLLTAYADTDAAIKAIKRSPAQSLFAETLGSTGTAVISRSRRSAQRLVRRFPSTLRREFGCSDTRWSSKSYDIRNFLARNQVPYQWLDAGMRRAEIKK